MQMLNFVEIKQMEMKNIVKYFTKEQTRNDVLLQKREFLFTNIG